MTRMPYLHELLTGSSVTAPKSERQRALEDMLIAQNHRQGQAWSKRYRRAMDATHAELRAAVKSK